MSRWTCDFGGCAPWESASDSEGESDYDDREDDLEAASSGDALRSGVHAVPSAASGWSRSLPRSASLPASRVDAGGGLGQPLTAAGAEDQDLDLGPVLQGQGTFTNRNRARDASRVRLHAEQVLRMHFPRAVALVRIQQRVGIPLAVLVQAWLVLEASYYGNKPCKQPLHAWAMCLAVVMVLNLVLNRPMARGSLGQRFICRWERDPDNPAWIPLRVKLYDFITLLVVMEVNFMVLYLCVESEVRASHHPDGKVEGLPICAVVAPGLVTASRFVAGFNLVFMVLMCMNMVGLVRLLQLALRQRLLHTTDAAPPGALERNAQEVKASDLDLEEHGACSICLEDFVLTADQKIAMTKACKHPFHRQCLQEWLEVNRTCPLCRYDLGDMGEASGSGPVPVQSGP